MGLAAAPTGPATRLKRPARNAWPVAAAAALFVCVLALPPGVAQSNQGGQGLQGGWAVDEIGQVVFLHGLLLQLPMIRQAEAGWVRINFRLGRCFADWTSVGCNGKTALQVYDQVVKEAQDHGFRVLGLLSNESWHGVQPQWMAGNAEVAGGNGDNSYIQTFASSAAGVLALHFKGRVAGWEIWNEPDAWTYRDPRGNPAGGTFIYPSNFVWLLTRSHAAIKAAHPRASVMAGAMFSHDLGGAAMTVVEDGVVKPIVKQGTLPDALRPAGPTAATCQSVVTSGADYLCATYEMGIRLAGWRLGSYPFDELSQHLYVDQGGPTSAAKITTYLQDVRNAYLAYEGVGSPKRVHITEFGWTTAGVTPELQAQNLRTAYDTFRQTRHVGRAYWFSIQDAPEANLYHGLVDGSGVRKPAFGAYESIAGN
jgi:hypothetical protein